MNTELICLQSRPNSNSQPLPTPETAASTLQLNTDTVAEAPGPQETSGIAAHVC